MKKSIASLQERLTGWKDWDGAMYELGACLGFWPILVLQLEKILGLVIKE